MKLANFINLILQKMVGHVEKMVKCLLVDHMVAGVEPELECTLLGVGTHRAAAFLGWSPP